MEVGECFHYLLQKIWSCQSVKAIWISGSPYIKNDSEMIH